MPRKTRTDLTQQAPSIWPQWHRVPHSLLSNEERSRYAGLLTPATGTASREFLEISLPLRRTASLGLCLISPLESDFTLSATCVVSIASIAGSVSRMFLPRLAGAKLAPLAVTCTCTNAASISLFTRKGFPVFSPHPNISTFGDSKPNARYNFSAADGSAVRRG